MPLNTFLAIFFFRSQGGTKGKNPDFGRFQKDNTFSKYAQEISQYWNFATKKQKEKNLKIAIPSTFLSGFSHLWKKLYGFHNGGPPTGCP